MSLKLHAFSAKKDFHTYSQLYSRLSSILIVKHVAPLRQYHAAYVGGHVYVGKVIFGLAEGGGGRGFGVFRLEHASEKKPKRKKN